MPSRDEIARAAAARLRSFGPHGLSRVRAIVGFDGFIDRIMRLVDVRRSMAMHDFEPIRTIGQFASRCAAAGGRSANIETVVEADRFGGNGPLMAGALGRLGLGVTYIGAVGAALASRSRPAELHPIYTELARRCRRVIPLGPPSFTACYEFDDGKLMFNETGAVQEITWDRIVDVIGLAELRQLAAEASLFGMVNWSLMGGVPGIWEGLLKDVFPSLPEESRRVFIDLSDPAKRTDEDLRCAMRALAAMSAMVPVTLGLNVPEAERVLRVLSSAASNPAEGFPALTSDPHIGVEAVVRLRASLGLAGVVVHTRHGAWSATEAGGTWFETTLAPNPRILTGAGDHFNAGFAAAQALGMPTEECLALGCAVSGAYVRDGESPPLDRVCAFLERLPEVKE